MRHIPRSLLVLSLALLVAVPVGAQTLPGEGVPDSFQAAHRSHAGHATLLGANMLVSGLTAGVLRWREGDSFAEGFLKGSMGGVATYAGKAMVPSRRGSIAPLVGRQVAAVGASAVRNAGLGEGLLDEVTLPLGPVRFHLKSGTDRSARLSVDVLAAAALTAVLLTYDVEPDWNATLATGSPVLIVRDPQDRLAWNGRHIAGTVLVRDRFHILGPDMYARALAHERVHLLQYDQFYALWGDPAERALLAPWPRSHGLGRHLDLGLHGVVGMGLRLLPYHRNPLEIEAHFLADTWWW